VHPGYAPSQMSFNYNSRPHSLVSYSGPNGVSSTYPSDDIITAHVQDYLRRSDMTQITKKIVREEASAFFGVPMRESRELINRVIEKEVARRTVA
jgi:hypothetical protein